MWYYGSGGQRLNASFSVQRKQVLSSNKRSSNGIAAHPAPGAKQEPGSLRKETSQKAEDTPVTAETRRLDSDKGCNTGKARKTHPGESHLAETSAPTSGMSTTITAEQAPLVRVGMVILMSETDQNYYFWATETVQKPT